MARNDLVFPILPKICHMLNVDQRSPQTVKYFPNTVFTIFINSVLSEALDEVHIKITVKDVPKEYI